MKFLKKVFKAISEFLFGVPKKEELPEACKPVFENTHVISVDPYSPEEVIEVAKVYVSNAKLISGNTVTEESARKNSAGVTDNLMSGTIPTPARKRKPRNKRKTPKIEIVSNPADISTTLGEKKVYKNKQNKK